MERPDESAATLGVFGSVRGHSHAPYMVGPAVSGDGVLIA